MHYRKFSKHKAGDTLTTHMSNTDTSKYSRVSKDTLQDTFIIFISTPCVSNCWYLKVNYLGSEKIRKLSEMTSTLRYRELTVEDRNILFPSIQLIIHSLRSSYRRTALNT